MNEQLQFLSFLFLLTISLLVETTVGDARTKIIEFRCETEKKNNSTLYVSNFVSSMTKIKDQIRTTGFGKAVVGTRPDASYGLAQCYGDLSLVDCLLCYTEGRITLPRCYSYMATRIFLDGCFLRADNYSFFEEITGPSDKVVCGNATRKDTRFNETVRKAVLNAAAWAPKSGGYARAELLVAGPTNESAYVLANCWKTLNASSCRKCLENASTSIIGCLPWSEGRVLNTGCFMRYSNQNFLNKVSGSGRSKGSVIVLVVVIVSSMVLMVVGAMIGIKTWQNRRLQKKRQGANDTHKMSKTLYDSSLNFKYSTLEKATVSFDKDNKIGEGGFGTVYKGVLPDGREIAVKRLFFNNRLRASQFYNEVNIISRVEHKNLVRLLGCSCSGPESLLVYEFLPNKSLDCFLFDPNKGKALNWEKRFEIILGTAEGLIYLHENSNNRIIHRDIKASNILLDYRLRAKIADFGLARSFQDDKSHISTAIAGTIGYMAPEYMAHGQLTEKADVYSFGVLLMEIVTGRQINRSNTSDFMDNLIIAAWKHFQNGTVVELFDPNLLSYDYCNNSYIKKEMLRVVHVGLLCVQNISSLRPSMSIALKLLVKEDEQLPAPMNPPFTDKKTIKLNDLSDDQASFSSFYPR